MLNVNTCTIMMLLMEVIRESMLTFADDSTLVYLTVLVIDNQINGIVNISLTRVFCSVQQQDANTCAYLF